MRIHCNGNDKETWLFCDIQYFKIVIRIMTDKYQNIPEF